jgi:hypothetical protein
LHFYIKDGIPLNEFNSVIGFGLPFLDLSTILVKTDIFPDSGIYKENLSFKLNDCIFFLAGVLYAILSK